MATANGIAGMLVTLLLSMAVPSLGCQTSITADPGESIAAIEGKICPDGQVLLTPGEYIWNGTISNIRRIVGNGSFLRGEVIFTKSGNVTINGSLTIGMDVICDNDMFHLEIMSDNLTMHRSSLTKCNVSVSSGSRISLSSVSIISSSMTSLESTSVTLEDSIVLNSTFNTMCASVTARNISVTNASLFVNQMSAGCTADSTLLLSGMRALQANISINHNASRRFSVMIDGCTLLESSLLVDIGAATQDVQFNVSNSILQKSKLTTSAVTPLTVVVLNNTVQDCTWNICICSEVNSSVHRAKFELSSKFNKYSSELRQTVISIRPPINMSCRAEEVILSSYNDWVMAPRLLDIERVWNTKLNVSWMVGANYTVGFSEVPLTKDAALAHSLLRVSCFNCTVSVENSVFRNITNGAIISVVPAEGSTDVTVVGCAFENLRLQLAALFFPEFARNVPRVRVKVDRVQFSEIQQALRDCRAQSGTRTGDIVTCRQSNVTSDKPEHLNVSKTDCEKYATQVGSRVSQWQHNGTKCTLFYNSSTSSLPGTTCIAYTCAETIPRAMLFMGLETQIAGNCEFIISSITCRGMECLYIGPCGNGTDIGSVLVTNSNFNDSLSAIVVKEYNNVSFVSSILSNVAMGISLNCTKFFDVHNSTFPQGSDTVFSDDPRCNSLFSVTASRFSKNNRILYPSPRESNFTSCVFNENNNSTENKNKTDNKTVTKIAGSVIDVQYATFASCSFTDNTGDPVIKGKAVTFLQCKGTRNSGCSDGGLAQTTGSITDVDGLYSENSAKSSGGTFSAPSIHLTNTRAVNGYALRGGFAYANGTIRSVGVDISGTNAGDGGALWGTDLHITRSNFTSCRSSHAGGAVYSSSTLLINKSHFLNQSSGSIGGAIFCNESGEMNDTYFEDCSAHIEGGSVYLPDGKMSVTRCQFIRSHAAKGGAIHTGTSTVTNSSFVDCLANHTGADSNHTDEDSHGGSIYSNKNLTLIVCEFHRSISMNDGGAIYGDRVTVISSKFEGCRSNGNGGALHGVNVIVDGTSFQNVTSKKDGGAIKFVKDSSVSRCSFDNISSDGIGGAISCQDGCKVEWCTFKRTESRLEGGAIKSFSVLNVSHTSLEDSMSTEGNGGALHSSSKMSVENATFERCTAVRFGGAIFSGILTVAKCKFANCSAQSSGGAVNAGTIEFTNSTVTECSCNGGSGGVYAINCNVSGSNFTNNIGSAGGGLSCTKGMVTQSNFRNNIASDIGGAVYFINDSIITSSSFEGNSATTAGGALRGLGELKLIDTTFTRNQAANGGSVSCSFVNGSAVRFYSNRARTGGALYAIKNLQLSGVHCVDCSADTHGGCLYVLESYLDNNISRSIFRNNSAARGAAVYAGSPARLFVEDSQFSENTATQTGLFFGTETLILENCTFDLNLCTPATNPIIARRAEDVNDTKVIIRYSQFKKNNCSILYDAKLDVTLEYSQVVESRVTGSRLIYQRGGAVTIKSTNFTDNNEPLLFEGTRVHMAGLQFSGNGADVRLTSCTALSLDNIGCYNGSKGACVTIDTPYNPHTLTRFTASGYNVQNRTALSSGGVIEIHGNGSSIVRIADTEIRDSSSPTGGAIYSSGASLTLDTVSILRTTATVFLTHNLPLIPKTGEGLQMGSAVFFSGPDLVILRSNFEGCGTTTTYGTVASTNYTSISIQSTSFTNNLAKYGGGLAVSSDMENKRLLVNSSRFTNNDAIVSGGAIYADVQVNGISTFSGNQAPYYGKDIALRPFKAIVAGVAVDSYKSEELYVDHYPIPVGLLAELTFQIVAEDGTDVLFEDPMEVKWILRYGVTGAEAEEPSALSTAPSAVVNKTGNFTIGIIFEGTIGDHATLRLYSKNLFVPTQRFSFNLSGCPRFYGMVSAGGRRSCAPCPDDSYGYGGIHQCQSCAQGRAIDGMRCVNTSPTTPKRNIPSTNYGFWKFPQPFWDGQVQIVRCPLRSQCLQDNICAGKFDVNTPVCSKCLDGYHHWNDGCKKCKNNYFLMVLAVIVILVAVNVYSMFIQRTALPSPTAALKIALQYCQIAVLVLPEDINMQSMGMPVQFFSGDPVATTSVLPCFAQINPVWFFHGPGILSALSTTALLIHRALLARWRVKHGIHASQKTTYNSLISLLFMSVFSTLSSFLNLLTCVRAGVKPDGSVIRVVATAPSINCDEGDLHTQHLIFLGVYTGIAWLVLAAMLYRIVRDYRANARKTTALWTFLFYHFENEFPQRPDYPTYRAYMRAFIRSQCCRWWQFIMLVRRVLLLVAYVLGKRGKIDMNLSFPVILLVFLYFHVLVNPYISVVDDLCDGAGTVILLCAMTFSKYLKTSFAIVSSGFVVLGLYTAHGAFTQWRGQVMPLLHNIPTGKLRRPRRRRRRRAHRNRYEAPNQDIEIFTVDSLTEETESESESSSSGSSSETQYPYYTDTFSDTTTSSRTESFRARTESDD